MTGSPARASAGQVPYKGVLLTPSLRALGSFLWVLLICAPSFAQAPTAAFAEVGNDARARFEQGMAAYSAGRFRAAIEHFKEADRLAPSARLSFNIALSYEQMDDAPNALAAYRDYLRRLPDAENAAKTSLRIAELELVLQKSGVQQLSVFSRPAGATVIIDDVSRGLTPWTGELPPGSHQLGLRLRGYVDTTQRVDVPARHAIDLDLELQPLLSEAPGVALQGGVSALPPAAPDAQPAAASPRWWTWAAFGSSAALLMGSGAFELSRRGLEADAGSDERDQLQANDDYQLMESRKTTARVLLGMGAVMGVVGGVSLYFDLARAEAPQAEVGMACNAGECRMLARGRF